MDFSPTSNMPDKTRSIKMKKRVVKKRLMYLKTLFAVVCSPAGLQLNIYYYYFYRSLIELRRNQKTARTSIKAGTNKMSCSVRSPKKISQINDCPRLWPWLFVSRGWWKRRHIWGDRGGCWVGESEGLFRCPGDEGNFSSEAKTLRPIHSPDESWVRWREGWSAGACHCVVANSQGLLSRSRSKRP